MYCHFCWALGLCSMPRGGKYAGALSRTTTGFQIRSVVMSKMLTRMGFGTGFCTSVVGVKTAGQTSFWSASSLAFLQTVRI